VVVDAEVEDNQEDHSQENGEVRSKKDLTEPTLLEMSGNVGSFREARKQTAAATSVGRAGAAERRM